MTSDGSCQTIIYWINAYIAVEKDKTRMIKDVFPRAYALYPKWRGGSFYDALEKLGEESFYDAAMGFQYNLLAKLGIERYYDLEGHDNTIDVLKLTKQILLYYSSHTRVTKEAEEKTDYIKCYLPTQCEHLSRGMYCPDRCAIEGCIRDSSISIVEKEIK